MERRCWRQSEHCILDSKADGEAKETCFGFGGIAGLGFVEEGGEPTVVGASEWED